MKAFYSTVVPHKKTIENLLVAIASACMVANALVYPFIKSSINQIDERAAKIVHFSTEK